MQHSPGYKPGLFLELFEKLSRKGLTLIVSSAKLTGVEWLERSNKI